MGWRVQRLNFNRLWKALGRRRSCVAFQANSIHQQSISYQLFFEFREGDLLFIASFRNGGQVRTIFHQIFIIGDRDDDCHLLAQIMGEILRSYGKLVSWDLRSVELLQRAQTSR